MYASFKDNIWAAYLAKMEPLSSFNCGVKYLLCVIDPCVKSLKDKKGKTVLHFYFIEKVNLHVSQVNLEQIKDENFTTDLCKNG